MARAIDADKLLDDIKAAEEHGGMGAVVAGTLRRYIMRQPTLTPPNEPERAGLYGKYTVYKNKDGSLVTDCFVLRPAKDPAAVAALRAYAAATDNAELAADIINWVGAGSNEPLTCDGCRWEITEPFGKCGKCIRERIGERTDNYECSRRE